MKTTYLFLAAWVQGSTTADDLGEDTHVHSFDELLPQFKDGNDKIFSLFIEAENENIASAIGFRELFFENYTAEDSVSVCLSPEDYGKLDLDMFSDVNTISL